MPQIDYAALAKQAGGTVNYGQLAQQTGGTILDKNTSTLQSQPGYIDSLGQGFTQGVQNASDLEQQTSTNLGNAWNNVQPSQMEGKPLLDRLGRVGSFLGNVAGEGAALANQAVAPIAGLAGAAMAPLAPLTKAVPAIAKGAEGLVGMDTSGFDQRQQEGQQALGSLYDILPPAAKSVASLTGNVLMTVGGEALLDGGLSALVRVKTWGQTMMDNAALNSRRELFNQISEAPTITANKLQEYQNQVPGTGAKAKVVTPNFLGSKTLGNIINKPQIIIDGEEAMFQTVKPSLNPDIQTSVSNMQNEIAQSIETMNSKLADTTNFKSPNSSLDQKLTGGITGKGMPDSAISGDRNFKSIVNKFKGRVGDGKDPLKIKQALDQAGADAYAYVGDTQASAMRQKAYSYLSDVVKTHMDDLTGSTWFSDYMSKQNSYRKALWNATEQTKGDVIQAAAKSVHGNLDPVELAKNIKAAKMLSSNPIAKIGNVATLGSAKLVYNILTSPVTRKYLGGALRVVGETADLLTKDVTGQYGSKILNTMGSVFPWAKNMAARAAVDPEYAQQVSNFADWVETNKMPESKSVTPPRPPVNFTPKNTGPTSNHYEIIGGRVTKGKGFEMTDPIQLKKK
jgi:hypothetical protein